MVELAAKRENQDRSLQYQPDNLRRKQTNNYLPRMIRVPDIGESSNELGTTNELSLRRKWRR